MRIIGKLFCLCLVIHAYANGGNWRYTVEHYACGMDSITTKYEYTAPAPAGALTRDQLQHELDKFQGGRHARPGDDSAAQAARTI